ncbi:TlyA family RNA methyltransferase [Thermodesulfitimonas sp.]
MMAVRRRLDVALVEKGFFVSREQARQAILTGQVFVNGLCVQKPGRFVSAADRMEVRGETLPYVSRGGLKLAQALRFFRIDLRGLVVIDVGASTGGFTDCALQFGARRVFAVDVGYGQLAWKLRTDPRVIVLERTNIRHLTPEAIGELADFATVDVSFISLEKVLPCVGVLLKPEGQGIALVKPQFEAGRGKVGKKGVVRDPAAHVAVCAKISVFIGSLGWEVRGLTYSPLRGSEGNIEFLIYFSKVTGRPWDGKVEEVVATAWRYFKG